jgi:hypothetical protein
MMATRTQMETLMQTMVLNLEMSNMVCLGLSNDEFYRAHHSSCRFGQLRAWG